MVIPPKDDTTEAATDTGAETGVNAGDDICRGGVPTGSMSNTHTTLSPISEEEELGAELEDVSSLFTERERNWNEKEGEGEE
jgi:hypothetical protein